MQPARTDVAASAAQIPLQPLPALEAILAHAAQPIDLLRIRAYGIDDSSRDHWCANLASGGFGTQVLHYLARANLFNSGCHVRTMHLPDRFVSHATPKEQYDDAGLTEKSIVAEVMTSLSSG